MSTAFAVRAYLSCLSCSSTPGCGPPADLLVGHQTSSTWRTSCWKACLTNPMRTMRMHAISLSACWLDKQEVPEQSTL